MMKTLLGCLALLTCVVALREELPILDLPWGKWQAKPHPLDPEIYLFENVRFGIIPERFGLSKFPTEKNDSLQDITQATSCIQVDLLKLQNPPGGRAPLDEPENPNLKQTEDCLFLDVYAPKKAFQDGAEPLPVIVWIYGGAYAIGSKNQGGPLYSGVPMLNASNHNAIFITGNYRVGAFGFLAGNYMESVAQPNAGLYDQALLFKWVQEHVQKVGGDKNHVSAWGESAGAGSILHHLIREDGKQDPLFHTFVAMSPAFEWAWDNAQDGRLDRIYKNFSALAGCGQKYDMKCLRDIEDTNVLIKANQELFENVRQTGLFPVGPAVDGKWIKNIPTIAFEEGKVWPDISSAIISHTANEAEVFTPKHIQSQEALDAFLAEFLPGEHRQTIRKRIKTRYACHGGWGPIEATWQGCTENIIRDVSFVCNTRDLFDAFPKDSYMMEYAFPTQDLALHGADLVALFANNKTDVYNMLVKQLKSELGEEKGEKAARQYSGLLEYNIREKYHKYFATFGVTGNPNPSPQGNLRRWSKAKRGLNSVKNTMQVNALTFNVIADSKNSKTTCDFWTNIAKEVAEGGAREAMGDL